MDPIKTNESNFVYLGPTREISDLHCRTQGADTYSVWEPTAKERELIAGGGHIVLGIHGCRHPPVSLKVVADGGPYKRVPAPCDVCGCELEDPCHYSDGHAYRSRKVPQ